MIEFKWVVCIMDGWYVKVYFPIYELHDNVLLHHELGLIYNDGRIIE